ncbi:hypothetical protein M514_27873 [Trichuris suis]|uniref:Uncharacterized protein n=1 Tax=Trichuris suis TaxID=68888 RepID=A0A085MRV8_9BILA|nr:hypothetical protein M514_27873 [Trichuris suis]
MAVSSSLSLVHNSRKLAVMAITKAQNDPVQCFPTFSPPLPTQDVVITPLDAVQFVIARRCQLIQRTQCCSISNGRSV